ncbi:CLUMA_CG019852, isoform A [Clunio marinus]|uniref:CLUMA_CG019852, isoform A n=1 Tax=Clunio marinus TaxID=568069 RepID=A0A1J1J2D7_9DIPT|nr:CLUMA_CG019852, isoform A [Clunio marinus]
MKEEKLHIMMLSWLRAFNTSRNYHVENLILTSKKKGSKVLEKTKDSITHQQSNKSCLRRKSVTLKGVNQLNFLIIRSTEVDETKFALQSENFS